MPNDELNAVPKSPLTGIPGWETEAEEQMLVKLAKAVPQNGVIVELGSEYGRSAGAFLLGSHESVNLISVDLFPENHPIVGNLLMEYQKNVGGVAKNRRVGIMQGDSAEAGEHWPEARPIDLLFIDAAHHYEAVQADIGAWVPYVRYGGVVAFHDCAIDENSHPLHHDVSRAINEWQDGLPVKWAELPQIDSLRVFIKIGE